VLTQIKRKAFIGTALAALMLPAAGAAAATQQPVAPTQQVLPKIHIKQMKKGAKGPDVTSLQQLLGLVGINVEVTGSYLSKTTTAVRHFQFAARLAVNGIATKATLRALVTAAKGPQPVESSGGTVVGVDPDVTRKLGRRIPLVKGMSGPDVRELQTYLRRAGDRHSPTPSGEFAAATVAAIQRFEKKHKRSVDGILDAGDIYALRVAVGQDASPGGSGDPADGSTDVPLVPGSRAKVTRAGLAIALRTRRSRSSRSSPRATALPTSLISGAAATAAGLTAVTTAQELSATRCAVPSCSAALRPHTASSTTAAPVRASGSRSTPTPATST